MKTLSTLLSLVLISVAAFATDTDPKEKSKEKEVESSQIAVIKAMDKIKLIYESTQKNKVKLTLFDASGNKLASRNVSKTDGFMQPFNTMQLEDGTYTIEIEDSNGIIVETIDYNRDEMKTLHSAMYAIDGGKKVALLVENSEDQKSEVRIYDAEKNLLHSEELADSFKRVYDIEKAGRAALIKVSNGSHTDWHRIN